MTDFKYIIFTLNVIELRNELNKYQITIITFSNMSGRRAMGLTGRSHARREIEVQVMVY